MRYINKQIQILFLFSMMLSVFILPANAALVDELRSKISEKNTEILKIEQEIAKYQKEIDELGGKADTLKNSIRKLNATRKKLEADILVTQSRINSTTLKIQKLEIEISEKSEKINNSNKAIGKIIRKIDEVESSTLVEVMLSNDTFSSFLDEIENLKQLQSVVSQNLKELEGLKKELETIKAQEELEQKSLINSRLELGDRKQIVESNKREKDRLLKITKNKESNYRKLVEEKRRQKEEFEAALRRIESQLKYELDKSKLPKAGIKIFSSPLPKLSLKQCYKGGIGNCITQYFGDTPFARSGAYNGNTHNGVDFRAVDGTKVFPVLSGKVVDVNNKVAPMCQYGKWILVDHGNGITTLYAHLELTKVKKGQFVTPNDVIAYSGRSGYAYGPHLHLTSYASDAVSFRDYKCKSGITVKIPVAAYSAYLNPLDYL